MPFRKIRHQMVFIVCLAALLGASVMGFFVITRLRSVLAGQLIQNQKLFGDAIRQGLALKFDEIRKQLFSVADHPNLQYPDHRKQSEVLQPFLRQNPLFLNAIVYDLQGKVISAADRHDSSAAEGLIGRNLMKPGEKFAPLQKAFQQVLSTNEMAVSERLDSLRQGPTIVMKVPIRALDDPRQVIGVLSIGMHVNGAALQEILQGFSCGNGFLILADRAGNILARLGSDLPRDLSAAVIQVNEGGPSGGNSTWTTLGDKEYLLSLESIPTLQGFLLVGFPRSAIASVVNEFTLGVVAFGVFSLLLAAVAALLLADRLIEQIFFLIEGIRKIGEGVLSWRVENPSDDELGEACRALNNMTERLERNRMIDELWKRKWNRQE